MRRLKRPLRFLSALLCLVAGAATNAAYLTDVPIVVEQPDGTKVSCLASGDEFYNWVHDSQGYVIVRDPGTGWLVYAAKQRGNVVPTEHRVGLVDPATTGLAPKVMPDARILEARRADHFEAMGSAASDASPAPRTGAVTSIVIFIRFADETEFTTPVSTYQNMLNGTTGSSLYRFYQEASYGKFSIQSQMYPIATGTTIVSYKDTMVRSYFQPYNAVTNTNGYQTSTDKTNREHSLLSRAVAGVRAQIPTNLNLDLDFDGYVDSIAFVIKGSSDGWSDLLWPHAWALYTQDVRINGKRIGNYSFQLNDFTLNRGVGVLAHETGHTIGMPDLYRYKAGEPDEPIGRWDLMASDSNPPQHMGAYMKWRYLGWIPSIPEITTSGTYTLNPLISSTNNCFKIKSPNSTTEYFVVEYRARQSTFENSLPGSGLLVYRINSTKSGAGNANGPPDEVYIYRPGGTPTSDGTLNSAFYSSTYNRKSITDTTSPSAFLADGSPGGLYISNIGSAGTTISFAVTIVGPGPTKLAIAGFSGIPREGDVLPFSIRVGVQDVNGRVVTDSTLPVTLSIKPGTGTAGATLSGTTTVDAVRGIATFTDLSIDKAGTGYVLTAASGDLTPAYSSGFAVAPFVFTVDDATTALQWAAGLAAMPGDRLPRWDVVTDGDSAGRVDMADVTGILCKATGLAPNP